ncbi:MAG: hypothetical protein K8E66_03735, partial [Phycisphaerales bacterium]|nr:hypothetical protein [Phycisphaerales bacterium]
MCTDEPVLLVAGGQALLGNDIRELAMNPSGSYDGLESFSVLGSGLPDVILSPIGDLDGDGRPDIVLAGGLRVAELGGADADPTPGGGLVVSNIGSSGEDGVAIDLGTGEGVRLRLAEGEIIEPGGALEFAFKIIDRKCPGCAPSRTASMTLEGLTTNEAALSVASDLSPDSFEIELYGDDDALLGSFTMDNSQSALVTGDPGDSLMVRSFDSATPYIYRACGVASPTDGLTVELSQLSGGTVSVTSPGGVIFTQVRRTHKPHVEDASNARPPVRGHVTLIKRETNPAGGTLAIEDIEVVAFGQLHHADGIRRIGVEECDDGNASGTTLRKLRACCLGSTGKDGVETRFGRAGRPGFTAPCEPDDRPVVGVEMDLHETEYSGLASMSTMDARATYGLSDGSVLGHAVLIEGLGQPLATVQSTAFESTDFDNISVFVRDAFGNVLAEQHGMALGTIATLEAEPGDTMRLPEGVYCSMKSDCEVEGGSGGNTDTIVVFGDGPSVTVHLPSGVSVPGVADLQICLMPAAGTTPACFEGLQTVWIGGVGSDTESVGFEITRQDLIYRDPPADCPADIDGNGILDL